MPVFNHAQREHLLRYHGPDALTDAGFQKLRPEERLNVHALRLIADPAPEEPIETPAQIAWRAGKSFEGMSAFEKEHYDYLGGEIFQPKKAPEPAAPVAPQAASPDPLAGLSPERKLAILDHRRVLALAADERARGVPEQARRVSRDAEERARQALGPYAA